MQHYTLDPVHILYKKRAARAVLLLQLLHDLWIMAATHRSDELLYRIGRQQICQAKRQN